MDINMVIFTGKIKVDTAYGRKRIEVTTTI